MENLPMIFETGLFIVVFIMVVIAGIAISFKMRDRSVARYDIQLRLARFVQCPEISANLYYRDFDRDACSKIGLGEYNIVYINERPKGGK